MVWNLNYLPLLGRQYYGGKGNEFWGQMSWIEILIFMCALVLSLFVDVDIILFILKNSFTDSFSFTHSFSQCVLSWLAGTVLGTEVKEVN